MLVECLTKKNRLWPRANSTWLCGYLQTFDNRDIAESDYWLSFRISPIPLDSEAAQTNPQSLLSDALDRPCPPACRLDPETFIQAERLSPRTTSRPLDTASPCRKMRMS